MNYDIELIQAIQTLPVTHREGKLSAYKLLCSMGVFNHDNKPSSDFLDMFLLTVYQGLLSGDEVCRKKQFKRKFSYR